ncbi:MAG: NADH:ubiquinone oxidoreductase [Bacteroidetes bacterium CG2_30_32_10]|nr:MAG: NADH:ubiquinone oxidoreductase [Bacteroidetes bacterium CG2_30_32_10]
MEQLVYAEEAYQIIGICMVVHRILGKGHSEVVYKDALEYEFQNAYIEYSREQQYKIKYKKIILSHSYNADFVVFDKIILEVKAIELLTDSHIKQTLNYLAASKQKLGLLVNFGQESLVHKRIIL